MKLFEIPDLNLSNHYSFHSKMFALNCTLQVANNRGKVFEVKDGKPVENSKIKDAHHLYSFANNTVVWRMRDKIERLESDSSFK